MERREVYVHVGMYTRWLICKNHMTIYMILDTENHVKYHCHDKNWIF